MRILRGRGTLSLCRHHTSRIQERRRQDLRWPPAARWLQAAQAGLHRGEVPKALCNKVGWVVEPDGTTYRKVCRRRRSPRLAPTGLVPSRVHQPVASEDL
jgi:hypothetical protein